MHVRVSRGSFEPSRADDVRALTESVRQVLRGLPGYRGYRAAVDRSAGTVLAISFWDSEEHARFPREALGPVMDQVQHAGVALEPADVAEVTVSEDR